MNSKSHQIDGSLQKMSTGTKKLFHTVKEFPLNFKKNDNFSQCELLKIPFHIVKNYQVKMKLPNKCILTWPLSVDLFSHCDNMRSIFTNETTMPFSFSQCEKENGVFYYLLYLFLFCKKNLSQCDTSINTFHLVKTFVLYRSLADKNNEKTFSHCDNTKRDFEKNVILLKYFSQCETRSLSFYFISDKTINFNIEASWVFNIYICNIATNVRKMNQTNNLALQQCESHLLLIQYSGFVFGKTVKALKQCKTTFSTGSTSLKLDLKPVSLNKLFSSGTMLLFMLVAQCLSIVQSKFLFLYLPSFYFVCILNILSIK